MRQYVRIIRRSDTIDLFRACVCVWRRWDAETGAARIDYHGGTASSYRQIVGDVVYRHMVGTAYFHSTTLLYV